MEHIFCSCITRHISCIFLLDTVTVVFAVSANIQPINTSVTDPQRTVVAIQTDVRKTIQKTQPDNADGIAEITSNILPRHVATRQEGTKTTENNAVNRNVGNTAPVLTPGNSNIYMGMQNENMGLVRRSFVEQTTNRDYRPSESSSQQIQRTGIQGHPMEEWLLTSQNTPYVRNQYFFSPDVTLNGDSLRNNGRDSARFPNSDSVYLGDIPMNIELHVHNTFYVLPQSSRAFTNIPILTSSERYFTNRVLPPFQYFPSSNAQLFRNADYNSSIYPYDMSVPRNTESRGFRPSFQGYMGAHGSTLSQSLRYPAGIRNQNNRRSLETSYDVPSNRRSSNIYRLGRSVLFQSYEPY